MVYVYSLYGLGIHVPYADAYIHVRTGEVVWVQNIYCLVNIENIAALAYILIIVGDSDDARFGAHSYGTCNS